MKDLRKNFERFCLKNRNRGIPNLMLVIAIGNLIAYALSVIDPSRVVYRFLCFSPSKILHGQIWRLFTYIFTYLLDVPSYYLFLAVVSLFCYYQFGKMLENYWGVCRFNLYYLTGVLLCDLAGLLLSVAGIDDSRFRESSLADLGLLGITNGKLLVAQLVVQPGPKGSARGWRREGRTYGLFSIFTRGS